MTIQMVDIERGGVLSSGGDLLKFSSQLEMSQDLYIFSLAMRRVEEL